MIGLFMVQRTVNEKQADASSVLFHSILRPQFESVKPDKDASAATWWLHPHITAGLAKDQCCFGSTLSDFM